MNKLNNHRQLKPNEIIREGDFYTDRLKGVYFVKNSIGRSPCFYANDQTGGYTFWRRRHTKQGQSSGMTSANRVIRHVATKIVKDKKPVAVVKFGYPSRDGYIHSRNVQVIGMDDSYLWGLEITVPEYYGLKVKYQFKKYLQSKMTTSIILKSYGPAE